jgi:RND family efflux transporter MFP subunit
VKEGESVKKGQVLVELDAEILRNNIQELKTSLELANTLYLKQKNLWDQNIGTEVQYLQAKNNKESLERKLKTTRSQLDYYNVKAPFNGRVYEIDVKLGSMMSPGMPVCRVVSLEDMYIQADVSESYVGKFEVGDTVDIDIPAMNITTKSTISAIGKVINVQNRTFEIEVKLPEEVNGNARPNQVTVLTITDYVRKKAITIPSKVVQRDANGNYIYVAVESENGMIAKKQHVTIGKSYKLSTEVLSGLDSGAKILTEGYRDVADGALINVAG